MLIPPFSPMCIVIGRNPISPRRENKNPQIFKPFCMVYASLLGLILFPAPSLAVDFLRVNYIVECDDPASLILKIHAKIQGLPAEETPLLLPDSHVTSLELFTVEGESERPTETIQESLDAPLGRHILLRGKASEIVSMKYQISLSNRVPISRHSYGDGKRCIIYASDFLLGFGEYQTRVGISFDLPAAWVAAANAKSTGKGLFVINGRDDVVFYLGTAAGQQIAFGQTVVSLAVEPGWEKVQEKIVNSFRRQITYWEKTSKDAEIDFLLISLIDSGKNGGDLKVVTLGNSSGFVASASPAYLKAADFGEVFEREASKSLIQCFFPSLRNSKESASESIILEYLLLKTDMKLGVLPKEEFLQRIAVGLGKTSEEGTRSQKRPNVLSQKALSRVIQSKEEKLSNLFLLDLLLGFYGRSTTSLEQLIHSKMNSVVFEKIVEGDPPRNLFRDSGFLVQQKVVFPKGEPEDISKRLKPFGLVFEIRELADLSFDLNENFQIEQIRNRDGKALMVGDKIIAIDGQKILSPVDLIKCRSEIHPGAEITLLIERSGEIQKIKLQVGREKFVRLEPNRLSDLDKQEKLEAFWRREVDQ